MLKHLTLTCDKLAPRMASGATDFHFQPGINLLVGANGSGKSTLFDLIAGGNDNIRKGRMRITTHGDAAFELRALRMQDQGRNRDPEREESSVGYRHLLMARFRSHGESNWPLLAAMDDFADNTILLLDEPEQALDLDHLLQFRQVLQAQATRMQIILATHHPLLINLPDAHIVCVDRNPDYATRILTDFRAHL